MSLLKLLHQNDQIQLQKNFFIHLYANVLRTIPNQHSIHPKIF